VSARDPLTISPLAAGVIPLNPRCVCRHLCEVHTPKTSNRKVRGACSAADPDKCPCKAYAPASA
jgi:hypothetical protein